MAGRPDDAARKRAQRRGRERGCWLYISGEQLEHAGFVRDEPPPFYRVWPAKGRPRFVVNLYREG